LGGLEHPNVLSLVDQFHDPDTDNYYIVMNLFEEGSLQKMFDEKLKNG
jgi:serine/threonine protein kinase